MDVTMGDKEDYLTSYRVFFEHFAATVNPEDQLPVPVGGYSITEAELPGEVLCWTTQYLTEKQCPQTLLTPLRRIILDEVLEASKKQPSDYGYKSYESVYIPLRLMQAVTSKTNEVCLRYVDNAQLDTLPAPARHPALRYVQTTSIAAKNARRVMEDRHVEIENLDELFGIDTLEPTSFYAVYDGHAGTTAAMYSAAHLHQYLVESKHYTSDLEMALNDAYLRTDHDFVRKNNFERVTGGTTAVTVTIRGSKLYVAWAGDSQALLAKQLKLLQLVNPHKPDRRDEKERIESSGGTVLHWGTWRVNGQLAVSRAIGDALYKPYVTAKPEVGVVDLDGDEDFVVIACDGLWDFVSEDQVALAVYMTLVSNPNDLKAVSKKLLSQAKLNGSTDNISVIVVFLKEPREIVQQSEGLMEFGLSNPLGVPPPAEGESCKRQLHPADEVGAEGLADNGVDNSDSDSDEDLGPETAVDVDLDDTDAEHRQREPAAAASPIAHADVEVGHTEVLLDNVAESGEESEDEWNYYKADTEQVDNPSEEPGSETPCQDNSGWDTSSVDMNSSPLNPDAPVFVPTVGGDVLLAQSPRKPQPMDDIELPDVAQFHTEAGGRPAECHLDNRDQLNGHHTICTEEVSKEHLSGNDTAAMDSLGFGFSVGVDPEKTTDNNYIQDFERIQKDTTDFCNIQVYQSQTETNNPFSVEANDELLERLKNKERDPMSMSFYQEKDDDTCEPFGKSNEQVDLNSVQMLPDSEDDEEMQTNGVCENKENVIPHSNDPFAVDMQEPDNDIFRNNEHSENKPDFGPIDSNIDFPSNNMDFEASAPQETIVQTETPESHKLLFEQIPEIPDGKSSELGFCEDDVQSQESRPFTPQEQAFDTEHVEQEDMDEPVKPADFESVEPVQEAVKDPLFDVNETSHVQDFGFDSASIEAPVQEPNLFTEELRPEETFEPESQLSQHVAENLIDDQAFDSHFEEQKLVADEVPEVMAPSPVSPADVPLPSESPAPEPEESNEHVPFDNETIAHQEPVVESIVEPVVSAHFESVVESVPVPEEPISEPAQEEPLDQLHDESVQEPEVIPVHDEPIAAPVYEEPIPEPVHDEPIVEPAFEAPVYEEPLVEPAHEAPVHEEPVVEPVQEEPLVEPVHEELVAEPVQEEPVASPVCEEPVHEEPVVTSEIVEPVAAAPEEPAAVVESTPEALVDLTPPGDKTPDLLPGRTDAATPPPTPAVTDMAAPLAAAAAATTAVAAVAATAAAKTPASAAKKTTTTRPTPGKTPTSTTKAAAKPATPRTTAAKAPAKTPVKETVAARTAPAAKTAPARTSTVAAKTAPARTSTLAARPAPAKAPLAAKPAAAKPAVTATRAPAARPAPATRVAAARPAPAPRTAPAKPAAPAKAAPAARPAAAPRTTAPAARPATARPAAKPAPATDKKPLLANGDARPPIRRPTTAPAAKPATAATAARPAVTKSASTTSPATRTARPALDKTNKELVNKRASAPAARVPLNKAPSKPPATKAAAPKTVPKKIVDPKKAPTTNGSADKGAPDALPDVIA